jgi:hypothetical protein
MPAPSPTAVNPSTPANAAPAAIFFTFITQIPSPSPMSCNGSQPQFMPTVGDVVQSTTGRWIAHPPTHCPNGHRLRPVRCWWAIRRASATAADTTWTRRQCEVAVCGPPLNTHCTCLDGPATVRIWGTTEIPTAGGPIAR